MKLLHLDIETAPRKCRACGRQLPKSQFRVRQKAGRPYIEGTCKFCRSAQSLQWQRANPRSTQATRRRVKLKQKFGITEQEYKDILASQGGGCAICAKTHGRRRLDVDHDHKTGAVRGILCEGCNKALGGFLDDKNILRNAILYLGGQT